MSHTAPSKAQDVAALEALERRRLRALVAGDVTGAGPLHATAYQLITPSGQTLTKADYLDGIAAGDIRYHVFEPTSDIAVLVSGDLGAVRYRCRIEIDVRGTASSIDGWHTDLYERIDGAWRAVWSQATEIR